MGMTIDEAKEPTTKNDLGVDCISRKAVQTRLKEIINEMETIFAVIREREVNDSVCGLCEYDCDHGLDGFANECPGFEKDDCFKLNEKYRAEWLDISSLPSVTSQKPFKPMVEIDLDYVIKQKYIEREVLDKIRAEIEHLQTYVLCKGDTKKIELADVLEIIDKYKAEIEPKKSEE